MKKLGGVLAALNLLSVPAAASASRTPLVAKSEASNGDGLARRPALIVYSGDGAAFLGGLGASARNPARLHWMTWAPHQARAWGGEWHDNCTPDCADGTYFTYRANVHLYRPRIVGGYWVFTRMTVTYTGRRPPSPACQRSSWTMRLKYSAQYDTYFWAN